MHPQEVLLQIMDLERFKSGQGKAKSLEMTSGIHKLVSFNGTGHFLPWGRQFWVREGKNR